MRYLFLFILCLPIYSFSQDYNHSIELYRNQYVADHLLEAHSPVNYKNAKNLRFYPIDETYKVNCTVEIINSAKAFTLMTHTKKKKEYFKYARLTFTLENKKQVLYIYQSKALIQKKEYRDYLFLPFTDDTNYENTFGGGRYLDFTLSDINNGQLTLDFNKAYNPYCAYAGGFNCPIPPKENNLHIKIKAGEQSPANTNIEKH